VQSAVENGPMLSASHVSNCSSCTTGIRSKIEPVAPDPPIQPLSFSREKRKSQVFSPPTGPSVICLHLFSIEYETSSVISRR